MAALVVPMFQGEAVVAKEAAAKEHGHNQCRHDSDDGNHDHQFHKGECPFHSLLPQIVS